MKPEQAMRTHPDIGLMTARQQACSRLAATIELQVNWNDYSGGEIEASMIQFF